MKVYEGRFDANGDPHVRINEDGAMRLLPPRNDLRNHSPDGFAWGYGGSGPAQLALAILADQQPGEDGALKYYQRFKARVIANLPQDKPWEMSETEVQNHVWQIRIAELREALEQVHFMVGDNVAIADIHAVIERVMPELCPDPPVDDDEEDDDAD